MRIAWLLVLMAACSSAPLPTVSLAADSTLDPSPPVTAPPTAVPSASPSPAPSLEPSVGPSPELSPRPAFTFGDGTHQVPADIPPGTYRTTAYTTDCYWTRLRGFQSGLDDLIATNIGSGFQLVTIGRRDAGFDSVSCGSWTSDLSPVLDPTSGGFGEGTYIVGTDIGPGEYIAGESQVCVWMRLAGFGFTRRQVLARAFVRGGSPPRVTILDTDVGFSSGGCGTWTRVDPVS